MFKLKTILVGAAACAVLILGTPLAGQSPAAAADKRVATFKDWVVACDNLHNCEANGFTAPEEEPMSRPDHMAILQLNRGGGPDDPVQAMIQLVEGVEGGFEGKGLVLAVDERPLMNVLGGKDFSVTLAAAQVGPLLAAARNGTSLTLSRGDQEVAVVSLAGMAAALRRMDDQQGRVGAVTAIVAKGAAPASSVPPRPAIAVVRRAPAIAQTGLSDKPPASVKALVAKNDCDQDPAWDGGYVRAYRLSADQVMWRVSCAGGVGAAEALLVVTDNKGGKPWTPFDGVISGGAYDPKTRLLGLYTRESGIGDCGEGGEWAWTGTAFVVIREMAMPLCRGQINWPITYQAKVE
jgi:hypothetical protein